MNNMIQIKFDLENINPLAMEITKSLVTNSNLINEKMSIMEATLIYSKQYLLALSCIEDIKKNPSILDDKEAN